MKLPALPTQLKFLSSTLARATELESREPIIAHYCKLHAAQQILGQGLHQSDDKVAAFASALLDDIEQSKVDPESSLASEQSQAILNDDETAFAYVENFAMNVFAKADAEVYKKTSNKITASKFMAASTFLDVLKVFKELDQGVVEKIKYSKFQAARILKACKNGEDPNDYEPPAPKAEDQGDLGDLDASQFAAENNEGDDAFSAQNPVETSPSPTPQVPRTTAPVQPSSFLDAVEEDDGSDSINAVSHNDPVLPSAPPVLPKAPAAPPKGTPTRMIPGGPPMPKAPSYDPNEVSEDDNEPKADNVVISPKSPPKTSHNQPLSPPPAPGPSTPSKPITKHEVQNILDETEVVSSAQKHAKYAISALNYDDMKTAITELEQALGLLKQYHNN